MSQLNLQDIFLHKYQSNQLAHFYILKASPITEKPEDYLKQWMTELLLKFIQAEKKIDLSKAQNTLALGHPDILQIYKDEDRKDYTLDNVGLNEFFNSQYFAPYQFSKRIIIFYDANHITEVISNKLLKILEEPQKNTIIFFVNPSNRNFLPTIESRAITICLDGGTKKQASEELNNLDTWLNQQAIDEKLKKALKTFIFEQKNEHQLLDIIKDNKIIFDLVLSFTVQTSTSYQHKQDILEEVQWFQKSSIYRNSQNERLLALLYKCFRSEVISAINKN